MKTVKAFKVKSKKLAGTNYSEVYRKAFGQYSTIQKRNPRRRAHIRSAYFKKDKIFLSLFWQHLGDKHHKDRIRRLKCFPCALELIRNSKFDPTSIENVDKKSEILHRFMGITSENEVFFVQIKEIKRNGQKYLISVFPLEK
ncbi:hypothetical protein COY07_04245 [Candidatus Peregrinibacteria bacterium CG_4_10_14_0_2_um_filter_43_11]|nr:MAG: hypothetical protein COY07_04245 [Candidatus Peregrinibacteria bacterium CG_4_10_14_0_2_um_filter_43_11]